jgi:hypothetical protein
MLAEFLKQVYISKKKEPLEISLKIYSLLAESPFVTAGQLLMAREF